MRGRLSVGTSGFSYEHWRDDFYAGVAPSRWLESYAERFSTVELNVSFYRLPAEKTFSEWARRTPEEFEFFIKGSRTITHYRRLKDADEAVLKLFRASAPLGRKAAGFLWQLPPRSAPDIESVRRFCANLPALAAKASLPDRVRHAFELRDPRWFSADVIETLRKHGYALVLADPIRDGQTSDVTADFSYLRFHHGPRSTGAYTDEELAAHAERTASLLMNGLDVYAFFNNDSGGWAPRNAESFRSMVESMAVSAQTV